MTNLQLKGSVAESVASLDAFAASDTKGFVNGVFKIRLLNVFSADGTHGTQLIFGRFIQNLGTRLKETEAQFAVSAYGIGVDTFHG